ncbi:MAG TPA: hypothetical protein VF403_20725 [Kofleriaceae bacterium]
MFVFVALALGVVGCAALGLLVARAVDQREQRTLQLLSRGLDGEPHTSRSFAISRGGQHVTFWRARRPVGKSSVPWTEIDVEIPRVYPLAMYVRRQRGSDRAAIERGATIDVEVGDGVFDGQYLIEAAPAAVIKKLLDEQTRTFMLTHGTVELMTKDRGGVRVLQLAIEGWNDDPEATKQAIAAVVHVASRLREAFTAAVEEVPLEEIGAPFRPIPDDRAQRLVEASHRDEVDSIETMHAERLTRDRATVLITAVVIIVAISLIAFAFAS